MTERKAFRGSVQHGWDATSLSEFTICPRKYFLNIVEGWEPRLTPAPLEFGRLLHVGREVFCEAVALGQPREAALRQAVRALLRVGGGLDDLVACHGRTEARRRSGRNLIWSIVWWVDEYGDADPMATLVLPDGRAAVELSFALPLPQETADGETYMLSGHLDRVINFAGALWVGEWKHTTGSLGPFYWKNYSPNPQISLYTAAARALFDGRQVAGTVVDATQVGANFVRFDRHFITRTRGQNEEFLTTAMWWMRRAEECARAGDWPMNESACGMYGGCRFRGVCALDPAVRGKFMEAEFKRRETLWDPMTPR